MTYDPKIPNVNQSPRLSVTGIRTNYQRFSNIFSQVSGGVTYNHIGLNDNNQGKHGAVLLQNQASHAGETIDEATIYSFTASSALGSQPQLFLKIPKFLPTSQDTTAATNSSMQLTYNSVNTLGPQYQSFLAGGYLIYFGSTGDISVQITLSPTPTSIICAHASPQDMISNHPYDVAVSVTQPDKIKINSILAPPLSTFLWFAIAQV